jgi:hypothetical protein
MIKTLSSLALAGLVAATITGCGGAAPVAAQEQLDERCHKEGELVPEWICNESIEGAEYAAVGMGTSGNGSMKKQQAIARARAALAGQIETKVKAKVEDFMRATGNGDQETIDAVTTSVTKQTAKVDLKGSRKVKEWEMKKSHNVYVLVAVDPSASKEINNQAKDTVKTSFKNDQALWQQFQSKNALEDLEKEFPTE